MSPRPDPAESPKRRRRDPEATRAAILDAAEALFTRDGVDATAISEIARRAGVTKSLIHHHFGTKEELWEEVKKRGFSEYYETQQAMLASASEGTAELLRQSFVAYFRFLKRHPEAVRFMSWRFVEGDDLCLEQEEELFKLGVARIEEAQNAGELRADLEPIFVVKSFLAMSLHWFQTKPLLCQMLGPEVDPEALDERYLEDVQKIFLEGILAR